MALVANGVMSCLACKDYPQPGVQQTWLTSNAQLRELTVREHSNCGGHCTSLALWESGGASTTDMGGLPEPVRTASPGLFQLVYRVAKRGSPPAHIPGDAEAVRLAGGTVTPSYRSHHSVATITHAIAAPIRSVEGEAVEGSNFSALAYDSSTDRSANKEELVYTGSLRNGEVRCPRAMFGYCADGAEVMQSTGNCVARLLMKLQEEVLGYSVVVPRHANCHRAHVAFRGAMDDTHELVDAVSGTMLAVVTWFRNATLGHGRNAVRVSEPTAVSSFCCARSACPAAHIPRHGASREKVSPPHPCMNTTAT